MEGAQNFKGCYLGFMKLLVAASHDRIHKGNGAEKQQVG